MPTAIVATRSTGSDSRKLHKGLCQKKWDTLKCCLFCPTSIHTKQPVGRNVAKICKTKPFEQGTTLMWKFLQILRVI